MESAAKKALILSDLKRVFFDSQDGPKRALCDR